MDTKTSRSNTWLRRAFGFALMLALASLATRARADSFTDFHLTGSLSLPSAPVSFDALPDGRLVAVSQSTVYRETAAGSHAFVALGALVGADIPSFGAAFVRVSPDGTKIAVGNNGGTSFNNYQVGVFTLAPLAGAWFSANHFDGEWADNRYVALTAGTFTAPSTVTMLDTTSANPASPVDVTVVNNIGGASGGIAFDAAGNLFTANGFQTSGPSGTGNVYAITASAWRAALAGGLPVNFETQGIPIVDLLSASPLGFDAAGNLLVGGGDSFSAVPDDNYFALVRASAVSAALAGGGFVNTSDSTKVRKLDPDTGAGTMYNVGANPARGEVYAVAGGSSTAFVYSAGAAAPAMPSWALGALATSLFFVAARRRRSAAV